MSDKIYLRRGNRADLPTLAVGEPGFAVDTKELFIGQAAGNVQAYGPYNKKPNSRAYANAVQTFAAGVSTKVLFQTESYDYLSEFNSATSTYTATREGIIIVCAGLNYDNPTSGNRLILDIYKNGAIYKRLFDAPVPVTVTNFQTGGCGIVLVNGGDYIEIYAANAASSATFTSVAQPEYTYFEISGISQGG